MALPVGWTRISHESNILIPRMSKCFDGPAPTISVKLEMPMPISSPRCALLGLLLAQLGVADHVHRLLQRRRVVAAVVLPAERRLVRELLRLDEVLHPKLGRIHLELVRHHVGHALDRVHGLGDAERAAIGDAARRLVGVDAVDLDERVLAGRTSRCRSRRARRETSTGSRRRRCSRGRRGS